MTEPRIDVISMVVQVSSKDHAYEVAQKCNQNMCDGKFSYFLVEQLDDDEWLVILAHNKGEAEQAQDKFYEEQD